MSAGFSGNIGYKLPENWNYDQINNIVISDSTYGSLEIDKDIYRGIIESVWKTTPNGRIHKQLVKLYDLAIDVNKSDDILSANKQVLDFLRGKYVAENWDTVAGKPDKKYIDRVKNEYNSINPSEINTKCNDISLNIQHFALSTKVCVNPFLGAIAEVRDYSSWAGDLVQLAAEIQKVYDKNSHIFTEDEIYNLIGCNDDNYAQSLGFENAVATGFSLEDLYQDMDAFIFGKELYSEAIYNIYKDYYLKEKYTNKERANKFYENLNKDGFTGTKFSILYQIAYYYTHKPPIFSEIFEKMFGSFDEKLWGDKLARALARKVTDMM